MGSRFRRPSHATVVAYLALFVALATGVGYAATQITSSKQVKKNVIKAKHVKDGALTGKDLKDGGIAGADVSDSTITGADVAPASVGGGDIANESIAGADVQNGSITGQDLNLSQLGFGQTSSVEVPDLVGIDNATLSPRVPEGVIASLDVPAGSYLLHASSFITADDNGGGAFCDLRGGGDNLAGAGAGAGADDFVPGFVLSMPASVSITTVAEFGAPTTLQLACHDNNTAASASNRTIEAVRLPG